MADQGVAQVDGESPFFGFDMRLLRHMATSIQTAHAANARSWAVSRTTAGSICLHIHAWIVLTIRQAGGDFYALGTLSDIESDELRAIAWQDRRNRLCIESLTADQFDRAYTLLREEHDALIAKRGAGVKTRAMRADHHDRGLVAELSLLLGIDLPEPEYLLDHQTREAKRNEVGEQMHGMPSNYEELIEEVKGIYDALSDEAKAAVNALPDDLFIDVDGNDCSGIFLDSIRRAHEQAPESWSLVSFGKEFSGFIALNIQNKNVATIWRKGLTVDGQRESIDDWPVEKEIVDEIASFNPSSESPTVRVPISSAVPPPVREQFIGAHHVLIDRLARGRSGIQAKNHRDDLRVKLALVANVAVPAPGYVPADTYGLPFGLRIVERANESQRTTETGPAQPTTSGQALRDALSDEVKAIYDALSPDAKAAVDALPDDLFIDPEGVDRSRWILKSLRLAHAGSPACWALMGGPGAMGDHGSMILTIGTANVISMRDKMRFAVRRDLVHEEVLEGGLQPYVSFDRYKRDMGIVYVQIDSQTPLEASMELERAHYETVSRLAKGKIGSQGRNHKDDARVKLALITGEYVPPPAYVPESTYGLPNGLRIIGGTGGEAVANGPDSSAVKEPGIPLDLPTMLPHGFASAGLTYTGAQIASFYTALQTKGFVILSGISGTGKSKIAQRFAELLATQDRHKVFEPLVGQQQVYRLQLRDYMKEHKRFTVPVRIGKHFVLPPQGESFDIEVRINGVGEGARARVWNQTPDGFQVFLRRQAAEAFRLMRGPSFDLRIEEDENTGMPKTLTVTDSNTENSNRGAAQLRRSEPLFLPVRPDWRDGKALIGYHNPLTGEYVRTDFLKFVIAAQEDWRAGNRNAFFVILDEMNLAHVEYYFADVLSVIESGRDKHGWTVEGIPLAVGEEDADLPERLHLPPNLYIVGTVNMDETTHPFSPKVLDRAFTIELTDVDFQDYPPEPVKGDADLGDEGRQALLRAFMQDGRYPRIDKDDIRETVEAHEGFRTDLENLNTSLKRYRMHFGYRVFDEIMQFVHNAEENGLFSPAEAFDHAVLMKVLPKFNGSRARLERPLVELILWSRQRVQATEHEAREIVSDLEQYLIAGKAFDSLVRDSDDWRYPATGKRAALMMQDLYTDGFAAFG